MTENQMTENQMTEKEMAESRFIASAKGTVFTPPQKVEEHTMRKVILKNKSLKRIAVVSDYEEDGKMIVSILFDDSPENPHNSGQSITYIHNKTFERVIMDALKEEWVFSE